MKKPVYFTFFIYILFFTFSCSTPRVIKKDKGKPDKSKKIIENKIKKINTELLGNKTIVQVEAEGPIRYTAFKLTEPLRLIIDLPGMKPGSIVSPIKVDGKIINIIKHKYFSKGNLTRLEIGLNKITPHEIIHKGENNIFISLIAPKTTSKNEKIVKKIKNAPVFSIDEEQETVADIKMFSPAKDQKAKISPKKKTSQKKYKNSNKISKKYTGRLISLDFQDAEITNILRLIADISKFNIIIADDVKGKVNLKIKSVPWDQALDIILKNKSLGMEKEGNIIRILPYDRLEKERAIRLKTEKSILDSLKTKENSEEMFTEVLAINYENAGDLVKNIEKLKSSRGEIDINERTNTLIIKDTKKRLDTIKSLIGKLDRRTAQVLIEARIVEVSRSFTRDIGIQWGGLYNKTTSYSFPNNIGIRGGLGGGGSASSLSLINTMPSGGDFVMHMPAAVQSGSGAAIGMTLGHITGSRGLDITLSALEDSGLGKILSNPKITTEDNKEAIIESGRSIPYATVSQSGTNVQFVNATINLTVKPHITQDDYVSLKITATKNDADFANSVQGTPSIIMKKASTQVLIKDGDTTVIGGLYTNNKQESISEVPWFARIPIIGWLFKKKARSNSSTELLIFITPKILLT